MTDTYEKQHAKVLRFEVSIGADDDNRTLEQFQNDVAAALNRISGKPIHNVTVQGGYYLIDGKVCLAKDYDPKTKNRIPGTNPPQWAGGPAPEPAKKEDHTRSPEPNPVFVRPEGFKKPERDPMTGRKIRSDKGKPRGPRKQKEDNG